MILAQLYKHKRRKFLHLCAMAVIDVSVIFTHFERSRSSKEQMSAMAITASSVRSSHEDRFKVLYMYSGKEIRVPHFLKDRAGITEDWGSAALFA